MEEEEAAGDCIPPTAEGEHVTVKCLSSGVVNNIFEELVYKKKLDMKYCVPWQIMTEQIFLKIWHQTKTGDFNPKEIKSSKWVCETFAELWPQLTTTIVTISYWTSTGLAAFVTGTKCYFSLHMTDMTLGEMTSN